MFISYSDYKHIIFIKKHARNAYFLVGVCKEINLYKRNNK